MRIINEALNEELFQKCKEELKNKGKFISGPFKNFIFDLIKKNKKNLKISVGNFLLTVSDKTKNIYSFFCLI